jgi:AcrR family transcriptional regulator
MIGKLARKRLDPATRAELILNVALTLFAERHYNAVSVRDIAEACEINAALIYYYFDSKDELLRRVLGHAITELQAGYQLNHRSDLDPLQELSTWFRVHIPIAPMIIRMVKIMADYSASTIRDTKTDQLILDFYSREQAFLEDCLHRGIAENIFQSVDVAETARAFSLQLDGIFYASQSRGDDRIERDIENLCAIIQSPALLKKSGR